MDQDAGGKVIGNITRSNENIGIDLEKRTSTSLAIAHTDDAMDIALQVPLSINEAFCTASVKVLTSSSKKFLLHVKLEGLWLCRQICHL